MLRALLSSKNNPPNKCRRAKNVLNIKIQNNYHAVRSLNVRPVGADEILEQRAQSQACLSYAES
jgi:hypothetical protein